MARVFIHLPPGPENGFPFPRPSGQLSWSVPGTFSIFLQSLFLTGDPQSNPLDSRESPSPGSGTPKCPRCPRFCQGASLTRKQPPFCERSEGPSPKALFFLRLVCLVSPEYLRKIASSAPFSARHSPRLEGGYPSLWSRGRFFC